MRFKVYGCYAKNRPSADMYYLYSFTAPNVIQALRSAAKACFISGHKSHRVVGIKVN